MSKVIYKIVGRDLWANAQEVGVFHGASIDHEDGFIHFSDSSQVRETARLHFAGQNALVLISVDAEKLGDELKWEASRNGNLFPHLYAQLELSAVTAVDELPLDENGMHKFPDSIPIF